MQEHPLFNCLIASFAWFLASGPEASSAPAVFGEHSSTVQLLEGNGTGGDASQAGTLTISGDVARRIYMRLQVVETENPPQGTQSRTTVKSAMGIRCVRHLVSGTPVPLPDGHFTWPSSERYHCNLTVEDRGLAFQVP